jgi:hypothetical protein
MLDIKTYILIALLGLAIFCYFFKNAFIEEFTESYANCSDISNCSTCSTTLTSNDGKCAWCKKLNSCVTTSAPLSSDPPKKKVEYNYFINNQSICDCGYDKSTCDVNCPPDPNPPPTPNPPTPTPTPPPAPSCSKYTLLQSPVYVKK